MCLSKTCLVADSSETARLPNFLRFCVFEMYLLEESSTCLWQAFPNMSRGELSRPVCGAGLVPGWLPPSCLWGEKSKKCNQLASAFFHNNKRLIKKRTAGGKMRGALQNWLLGRFQPGQQSACGWWGVCPVVPDVPSTALLLLLLSPQLAHKTGAHCYSR